MDDIAREYLDFLVRCDALRFGDFTAKSGRATPYFIDSGRIDSGPRLQRLGRLYAARLVGSLGTGVDLLFGPAYKGIPLAVATSIALAADHGLDVGVAFDRKEAKDHGEGGSLVGRQPADGARVVIVEDVTTAGTSIRSTVPQLQAAADVRLAGLLVGVDRQERAGRDDVSALAELSEELDLPTASLATVDDVVAHLAGREIDGRVVLGDEDLARIEAYRAQWGAQG